jgi:hypothetical protein
LIFVQASGSQLATQLGARWSLTRLAIFAAIAHAALAEAIFGLTSSPQFLALACSPASPVTETDTSRTKLQDLGKGGSGKYEESRRYDSSLVIGHGILLA